MDNSTDGRDSLLGAESGEDRNRAGSSLIAYPASVEMSAHPILGPFGADRDLRRWGLKLAERGGRNGKKRALMATARKLAASLSPGSCADFIMQKQAALFYLPDGVVLPVL